LNNVAVQERTEADTGPDLLLQWQDRPDSRVFFRDAIGSLAINVILFALAVLINSVPGNPPPQGQITVDLRKAVHLVAPRLQQLTQKEPNKGEVPKEVNVEGLLARPAIEPRIPQPPRTFRAPAASAPAPPPKNQSQEPPALALQTPGQNGSAVQRAPGQIRVPPPKTSVDDAIRSVVNGAGQGGGITVGDEDQPPSLADQLRQAPTPGRIQSSLQLLSDPQGVDFKPYLIRILATVRRNWLVIIPESARMGRRGKVLLQFIVDRNGSVPKLVIAMPSGAEALDRAAVAGISASVPFPPLPPEFKGNEVRLQFAFTYNMK
jgi:TonB family protein